MSKKLQPTVSFVGGIGDSLKAGSEHTFAFLRGIDFRSDPAQSTVNPKTQQEAAGIIADLIMWMDTAGSNKYFQGNTGYVYKKDVSNVWSIDHISPNCSGNGMAYFAEDENLYYAQNTTIGRKSFAKSVGVYYDGFLESEGGEPTNPSSALFVRSSSQYASIADQASLSITLDLAMESYVKLTSLPASLEVQTLMSKWNESGNQRSFKFDITTSANQFGDGSDGARVISANTTETNTDSQCSGTIATHTLSATNASFQAGQLILIIQMQGTGASTYQKTKIQSYTAGTITTTDALTFSFSTSGVHKAQVLVRKQYTNVTVNAGVTWTAKSWNPPSNGVGGILSFVYSGTLTVNGTITAVNCGYLGGNAGGSYGSNQTGQAGESPTGVGGITNAANGGGGGGGSEREINEGGNSGGGAAHATAGTTGSLAGGSPQSGRVGIGASTLYDAADGSSMNLGSGGGGGGIGDTGFVPGTGGGATGGGVLDIYGTTLVFGASGLIDVSGQVGQLVDRDQGAGGDSSAGCINLGFQSGTYGTNQIKALGGNNGTANGLGGNGHIVTKYSSVNTGTTTPASTSILDTTLSNVTGYVMRLLISNDGINVETYTQDITNIIQTAQWGRYAVSWDASTSTASFYKNASLLGTQTGIMTAIFNSTARFALATSYDSAGAAKDFLNGRMDDVRLWNAQRSQTILALYNDRVLEGVETNLSGYWKLDGNVLDSQTYTTNADLTATGTPTYSSDVGFSGFTTRADQDVKIVSSGGQTYTLLTSISESTNNRRSFIPTKEPLKSVQVNIAAVGTGNWTFVIHDGLNREQNTITIANADLHTGLYEVVFPTVSRPVLTAVYHLHIYSTVADGTIVTSTLNKMQGDTSTPWLSLTTGTTLSTFFQILVSDIYHPITQFLNFLVIGNERYVAKLEAGNIYNPHQITLPAGYRVRCFTTYRDYIAIGVWKGSSITDTDQGKIFLWDGSSDTAGVSSPNTIIDVLEGGVNAMTGAGGILYVIAGYEGNLLAYGGGETQKIKQIPLLGKKTYAETAPGAMTMWRSMLHFGSTLNTNSTTIHQGVYSYGKLHSEYPNSLGFDYPLSIGDQQSATVRIGSVFPAGQSLYIGWQNGNVYGIDTVSVTNDCYASATIELLITDYGRLTQNKLPLVFRVDFEPLEAGQSVVVKFKADRESSWRILETQSTLGATQVRGIFRQQVREIQCAVDLFSTSGVPVKIIQAVTEFDDQEETRWV